MEPVIYIQVGDVQWAVLSDGSWVEVLPTDPKVPGVTTVVVNQEALTLNTGVESSGQDNSVDTQVIETRVNSEIESAFSQDAFALNESSQGLSFVSYIRAVLPEKLVSSGYVTRMAERGSDSGQTPQHSVEGLSQDAALTVEILDGGDGYENQFEVPGVTIQGRAVNVSDNWVVDITIRDNLGQSVTVSTKVDNQFYQISGVDLSSLAEGPLTVASVIRDAFGNSLSANDATIKDTLAEITVAFEGNGDAYLNQFEVGGVQLTGSIKYVEDGQPISVSVTDSTGASLTFESIVSGGGWTLNGLDLSGLSEGVLTVVAKSVDIAGNPAIGQNTIVKDTQASITVDVDDGGDDYLNITERQAVTLFGQVTGVEDGQSVTVVVTDSLNAQQTFSAFVSNGEWRLEDQDLSSLADGTLSVSVSTSDVAGNPAQASDTATSIDATSPTIDIDTGFYALGGLDINDFRQGLVTEMRGSTTGVQTGLTVSIRVSDGTLTQEFTGNVDASGNWTVSGIAVDTLNQSSTWTIEAEVQDAAGNSAVDDMPTIVLPDAKSFSENIIGFYGQQTSSANINIENGEAVFHDDQSIIASLTSVGEVITTVVASDGKSLVGTSTDNRIVFTALINDDGTVKITFFEAVDQASGEDYLITALLIDSTQTDADGTTETVVASLPITIYDSDPVIHDESYSVVEDNSATGNVLDNDVDLDGALYVKIVEVDGVQKVVPDGGSVIFSLDKGTLTVYSDGRWEFEAARNLDNSVEQLVTFDYAAADSSRDYGLATATIEIVDGVPGVVNAGIVFTTEVSLSEASLSMVGNVNVAGGSDNPDPDSLYFNASSLTKLQALGLTSSVSDDTLSYALSADGKQITATVNGITVFTLLMSGVASGEDVIGSITLDLAYPLDQLQSGDSVELPLVVEGQDLDATPLGSNNVTFVIQDGADPVLTNTAAVSVNEADLAGGTVTATGGLHLDIGSDYVEALSFSDDGQPTLTSGGSDILYQVSADGLSITGYILSTDGTTHVPVFQATLTATLPLNADSDINYSFELFRALDQLVGDSQTIPLVVNVVDSDDDEASLSLDITVNDNDNGDAAITNGTVNLTETPIDSSVAPSGVSATADVNITVTSSFDPIVFLGLNVTSGETVVNSDGDPVTYNGDSLVWRDNGDGSYDAIVASGDTVFSVTLPSDFSLASEASTEVAVSIELYRPLDHTVGAGTEILIPVPVMTRDSDGTEISVVSNINIYDGQKPQITVNSGITVNESGLTDDAQDSGTETSSPSLTITQGSDDVVGVSVDIDAFNALGYQTSAGSAITLNAADSDGWLYATDGSAQNVFRVRFNLDGTVDFELYQALEHAPPSGVLSDQNELQLNFAIAATDQDGDSSSSTIYTVSVVDDVPQATTATVELTEGDEYASNWFTNHSDVAGADGATIASLIYQGVTYDASSAEYSGGTWTIDLLNTSDGNSKYGTLVISENGDFTLTTELLVSTPVNGLADDLTLTIVDADGDQVDNNVQFTLNDFEGFIRVVTVNTLEDSGANNGGDIDAVELPIKVSAGDTDNNEQVQEIRISVDSLQSGTLFLDGVALSDDDSDGFINLRLSDGQITQSFNFYIPNGILTFQPALNTSDNTVTVSLDISAVITSDLNPDGVVLEGKNTLDVNVIPVADAPEWNAPSAFEYQTVEDAGSPTLFNIVADLYDVDGSETLHYQISNVPDGLTITLNGNAIVEGQAYSQSQLNQMSISTEANLAGQFTFDITAVSTESGSVFADEQDKTADITHQIVVNVSPDADTPTLTVNDIKGLEDQAIDLKDYISGNLTDTDGSESLAYRIEVQDGWTLPIGSGITLIAANTYLVTADALASSSALLQPKADISSYSESLSIQVTAIATESTIDGLAPINETAESTTQTIDIHLKGVVDEPDVLDGGQGHWQYDDVNRVISNAAPLNEDNLIQLDFILQTSDDDQSEEINVLLSNIPDGTLLVDANGDPVTLPIAYIDPVTGPVYQVSNSVLADTYLKPAQDFSGELSLDVIVVSTEPDGASGEFPLTVEMNVLPVVDQNDGQSIHSSGVEDRAVTLNLDPLINQDSDSSESLTGYSIDAVPDGLTLYFDAVEVVNSSLPLDLSTLLDGESPTLDALLASGRLTVKADEDLSGEFSIPITYEVTDTSPTADTDVKAIAGSLDVVVEGKVDIGAEDSEKTRLEGTSDLLTSTDGSAIDVSGAITFTEADLDGSEYLDYIVLQFSGDYNLVVSHPNGVSQDANGNWLIPMDGITSDSVIETAQDLLAGATIYSSVNTEVVDVTVKAFVKDGADSQYITGQFQLQVTGHSSGDGSGCEDPSTPGSVQGGDIIASEGESIAVGQYLNSDVGSDADNLVSFFIPADSLPEGVIIEGEGVTLAYDTSGNLLGYSISVTGLQNMVLSGIDEDFAGCISFSLEVTETAPCDGDSLTTSQTITVQIAPVVDEITLVPASVTVQEDTTTALNLELVLGDSVESGQTITGEGAAATGLETVNWVTISLSQTGAVLSAQDASLVIDNGDGTWTVTDASRLDEIQLLPPANFSGDIVLTLNANITDEVTGSCLTGENASDTQTKTTSVTISVEPVVDKAVLVTEDVVGNEDNYIYLGNLSASLIDQDGSESLSLVITGVPEGAVLVWNNNGLYELLPNNGSTSGTDTEWQVTSEQLNAIYILPPQDFSGDISLTLQAITQEIGTDSYNFTLSEFNVGVLPVGDDTELTVSSQTLSGDENDSIHIAFEASSFETNSNEYLEVSLTIKASSDATALDGLGRIRIGNQFALFTLDEDGNAVATILVKADEVDGLDFIPKDAFGSMDATLSVRTYDQATVSGSLVSDYGEPVSVDLNIVVAPEPDEPTLTVAYHSIVSEASGEIPLGLDMTLVNPAGDESGQVTISGLSTGFTLNHGSYTDGVYSVAYEEVSDLSIIGGYSGSDEFELTLTPSASIGDSSAPGLAQVISISLVEPGDTTILATDSNDLLIGGSGSDIFSFASSGVGSTLSPTQDVISDFQISLSGGDNDTVDVSAIITAATITDVDNQIDLREDSQGVTLSLKPDSSGTKQEIMLEGVTLDDLYQGDASAASEADVLQKMIDDNNLLVSGL
ncbi:RTX toxin [Vibrio fluvialis]|nr:RTX toxin [Vibrio fluvialis]